MAWIDEWAAVAVEDLSLRQARIVNAYMRTAPDIATVVEARRHPTGAEMVLVDIRTGVPQRPVVPIERVERIGIAFGAEDVAAHLLRTGKTDVKVCLGSHRPNLSARLREGNQMGHDRRMLWPPERPFHLNGCYRAPSGHSRGCN